MNAEHKHVKINSQGSFKNAGSDRLLSKFKVSPGSVILYLLVVLRSYPFFTIEIIATGRVVLVGGLDRSQLLALHHVDAQSLALRPAGLGSELAGVHEAQQQLLRR